MTIEKAVREDAPALADIFIGHISAHPEYISHGELQMGVGEGFVLDGAFVTRPSADAREKWMEYILLHIDTPSLASVFKAVSEDGQILGFTVADIEEDGDAPFGMVCDILVSEDCRGKGVGGLLLDSAISWLNGMGVKDIYLESGKDNHKAHHFFEKRGFMHVSQIFKKVL
ncbi:MAG: GNAT family N-acetyltransferase [Bacteroidales bacterium]|nr:GNAT family N-acetyltransferase [Bacteroidales bacterium]